MKKIAFVNFLFLSLFLENCCKDYTNTCEKFLNPLTVQENTSFIKCIKFYLLF